MRLKCKLFLHVDNSSGLSQIKMVIIEFEILCVLFFKSNQLKLSYKMIIYVFKQT